MSDKTKDTIYIDVEEEITGIVSKVQNSSKDIVALVLPKRASVMQSVVNMKLLKRSAEQAGKKLVLITSESRILPLAGAVGVFVASNLTSKPYIPPSPKSGAVPPASPQADAEDVSIDPETPVSQLAPEAKFADDGSEGIEIDNTKPKAPAAEKAAKSSGSKLKVPSFSRFRKRLILGGAALVALIAFLVWAIAFAPSAQVTVRANTKDLPINIELRANKTEDAEANPADKVVRATTSELEKEDSETVAASGEKNTGNKASGKVTLQNCSSKTGNVTIPKGTGVSSGDATFITSKSVTLGPSLFDGGGNCVSASGSESVTVIAQEPGEKYNLSARSYGVNGYNGINGQGSDMSGGTDKTVKVVADVDVKKAKERLNSKQNTAQDEIEQKLSQSGFTAVEDSFDAGDAKYDVNPGVGSEADEVTVKSATTYKMLGINTEDIKKAIEEEVKNQQEGGTDQSILSDGLNAANFRILSESDDSAVVTIETTVVVGPDVDENAIKTQIEGKKDGEAESILNGISGFSDAQVDISPFWVTKVPKADKVEFIVQQADGQSIPQ